MEFGFHQDGLDNHWLKLELQFCCGGIYCTQGGLQQTHGPTVDPIKPKLVGVHYFVIPMFDPTPLASMVVPFLHPMEAWRPIIWGTLGNNHICKGRCKPTILIGLHYNPTTSPSPWSPFNGGLMVGILVTFLPKTSISKHKE